MCFTLLYLRGQNFALCSAGKELEGAAGVVEVVVKDHTTDEAKFPPIKRVESTGKGLQPENHFPF